MINFSRSIKEKEPARQYLKQTRSLCPACYSEIDAALYRENPKIIISKTCPIHGTFSDVVDPDADIYLQCVSASRNNPAPYGTVIPISFRCDLNCTWCYLPEREAEPSLEQIIDIINRCSSRYIVFSGGEPTMHPELPSLIAYVRKNYPDKQTVLLTNGINIANYDYALLLKKAGLQYCIVSFNGFRPSTHKAFNGRDLSLEKKCALHNLKKLNIWTILSMTLAKGINEDEFLAILLFGLSNLDFVRQIRLRNVSDIGKYRKQGNIYMSDMLKIVSEATGFSLAEMCTENNVANRRRKTGNYFIINIFNVLKRRGKKSRLSPLHTEHATDISNFIDYSNALKAACEDQRPLDERMTLSIEVFSWPTAGNIDLDECRRFCIEHVTNDWKILPFWEALFRNELLRKSARERFGISNK